MWWELNPRPQNLTHQSFTRFRFVRYVFGLSFEKSNLKQGANWNVGVSTSYLKDSSCLPAILFQSSLDAHCLRHST